MTEVEIAQLSTKRMSLSREDTPYEANVQVLIWCLKKRHAMERSRKHSRICRHFTPLLGYTDEEEIVYAA